MGASFHAYRMMDLGCCDMGYGRVHMVRMSLLAHAGWMCGVGTDWSDRYGKSLQSLSAPDAILDSLFREMEDRATAIHGSADWEILIGVIAFCNHSDCGGDWYCEDCKYIAKAIRATLDSSETDERGRRIMEGLCEVFESASEDGCRVEISRSRRTKPIME